MGKKNTINEVSANEVSANEVSANEVSANEVSANEVSALENAIVAGINNSVLTSFRKGLSAIPVTSIYEDAYKGENGELLKSDVYKFTYTKGKTETTITVRDAETVNALVTIERLSILDKASAYLICSEMNKIKLSAIEKLGFDNVWTFVKTAFSGKLDENTLSRYYRISKLFFDGKGSYRIGIDLTTSISNLDVASAVFEFKKNNIKIQDLSDEEIETMFDTFYREYIVTDKIVLSLPQKKLKEEVQKIIKGTFDEKKNDKKTDSNNGTTDSNNGTTDSNNDTTDSNNGTTDSNNDITDSNKDISKNEEKKLESIKNAIATIYVLITDDEIKKEFTHVCEHIMSKLA